MKKFKCLMMVAVVLGSLGLSGCSAKKEPVEVVNPEIEAPENLPVATITIKDFGVIEAELYPHIAPNTVNNFITLASSGFYDGIIIHRVEKNFVLQGGDPTGVGSGGPGYSIEGEFYSNGFGNYLNHTEGVLSMARTNEPNSAGSQFFIMLADSPHLDGNYAGFGLVTSGMDVAHAIEAVEVLPHGKPVEDVVIESITVETFGVDYPAPVTLEEK
ncbi:MAG: peptidylprolyl isomerase [Turicibacter sp.]